MSGGRAGGAVTVGVDIGTTSVKAVAVDETGSVLARARVPHQVITTGADRLEHDAARAWRRGPKRALTLVTEALDRPVAGVASAAMVPSLTAVDKHGRPKLPGLLYGDARGGGNSGDPGPANDGSMPDAEGFLAWAVGELPDAAGYWPAQAVATAAMAGRGVIDSAVAASLGSLLRYGKWNERLLGSLGVGVEQMPEIALMCEPAGTIPGTDTVFAGGTVDAFCDQIVSGATEVGDVLVIFGATLITWAVAGDWIEVPGLMSIPHTTPDRFLVGGPSNAGALFADWARGLVHGSGWPHGRPGGRGGGGGAGGGPSRGAGRGVPAGSVEVTDDGRVGDPFQVPVWLPYLRGERAPLHDPGLRASLHGLDITQGPEQLVRAAFESSGFVVRRILERTGVPGKRVVASGGGTRVPAWMAAVADATGLPVDPVGVPEGAAYGAAFIARMAAGLEQHLTDASRWARPGTRVEPDPQWARAADARYQVFLAEGGGA